MHLAWVIPPDGEASETAARGMKRARICRRLSTIYKALSETLGSLSLATGKMLDFPLESSPLALQSGLREEISALTRLNGFMRAAQGQGSEPQEGDFPVTGSGMEMTDLGN